MWQYRVAPYGLVLIIVLLSCPGVRGGEIPTRLQLSPAQLHEDIDFLFLQLESVHPDVCASISRTRFEKMREHLRAQCRGPLTLREFYEKVAPAVDRLGDGHTLVHAPLGRTPSEQKKAMQAELDALLATQGANQNSYELLPQRNACILRYNSCGLPHERPRCEALFAEMFAEIRRHQIQGLIIDLRQNGGGYSGTSDALLRYLARTPFRQYERVAKRWTPQALAFYQSVRMDYMSYLHEGYDTSSLPLDPSGLPLRRDFTLEARFMEPVQEPLRFTGPVCVLISRATYSSAALFASTVRHYGLAPLIGEQTLPFVEGKQHYGDVIFIALPHSQLTAQISTAVFTVMRADNERSARIVPDHEVVQTSSDTEKKIDTVEAFALDLLEKRLRK